MTSNPNIPTQGNEFDEQSVSRAKQLLDRGMENLRRGIKKTTVIAVGATTLFLAGCTTPGNEPTSASPTPTETSQPVETPTTKPSPTSSPEVTPTTAEHKFSGTINYDKLTGPQWEDLNPLEQQKICSEFFADNIKDEFKIKVNSTGVEITKWFNKRLSVVEDLVLDDSDERNFEAAKNIGQCLSMDYIHSEEESLGRKDVEGQISGLHQSNLEGLKMVYMEPDQITRYSTGTFPAEAKHDLGMAVASVEGHLNNGLGGKPGQLVVDYFQWSEDEGVFRFIMETFADDPNVPPYFGDMHPPVVLDPSRENAPNSMDREIIDEF